MVLNNNFEAHNRNSSISLSSVASNSSSVPPYPGTPDAESTQAITFNRIAYNVPQFNDTFYPISISKTRADRLKTCVPDMSKKAWIRRITTLFPILSWIPEYDIKNNLLADIVVGVTIAVFQIPQSNHFFI